MWQRHAKEPLARSAARRAIRLCLRGLLFRRRGVGILFRRRIRLCQFALSLFLFLLFFGDFPLAFLVTVVISCQGGLLTHVFSIHRRRKQQLSHGADSVCTPVCNTIAPPRHAIFLISSRPAPPETTAAQRAAAVARSSQESCALLPIRLKAIGPSGAYTSLAATTPPRARSHFGRGRIAKAASFGGAAFIIPGDHLLSRVSTTIGRDGLSF